MEFVVDQLRILGLGPKEVRVFTTLSTFGRMNVTNVAKRANLPRTTVDAIIRRLIEQGLVARERVGGHYEYEVKLAEVADKLGWIQNRLQGDAAKKGDEGDPPCDDVFQVNDDTLQGVVDTAKTSTHTSMHEMMEEAFVAHTGERCMMLCSTLLTIEKRMERFEHCLLHARTARMHMELLMTTDVSEQLSQYAKEILALLTAYDLRMNFLPNAFCIEHTDLVAFRDEVVIVDHHQEVAVRVDDQRVVDAINHLLLVAREVGWGMDMKMWLEGVLEGQEHNESKKEEAATTKDQEDSKPKTLE